MQPKGSSLASPRRRRPQKWRASTIRCLLLATTLFTLVLWVTLAIFGLDSGNENDIIPDDTASSAISNNKSKQQPQYAVHTIPSPKATIAYAVSLTSCGVTTNRHDNIQNGGHSSDPSFHEGAAVLKHSIHLSSIRNYHQSKSLFDYEMIAFVHPNAESCSNVFKDLGYTIQIRETPFNVTDIKEKFLREHIVKSGCCGEKEYLKLYAYALLDYPIVIHLDLDSLVLKPMDDLFLAMLDDGVSTTEVAEARSRIPVMFNNPLPEKTVDAYFTKDYNMINPGHKHVGVQGGFLIVKPNMDAFHEYVDIVIQGRFFQGSGWEGKGYGGYFGAQQIQGICSFYYDYRHPNTGVELNRCYYNAMADAPRPSSGKNAGKCRDGRDDCQDCRDTPIEQVKSVHFTLCLKPWKCPTARDICAKFHQEWFRIRDDLERKESLQVGREYKKPGGKHMPEVFHGYCKGSGERGYIPIGRHVNELLW
mmetsp:Transcript_20190/g.43876  ORF Transcript_20190/g.43876 Transcript_20190/m.43876 type:complete len:476 (-) Transcript_20190:37-1464(-)